MEILAKGLTFVVFSKLIICALKEMLFVDCSPDEKGETTLDAMIMDGYGTSRCSSCYM